MQGFEGQKVQYFRIDSNNLRKIIIDDYKDYTIDEEKEIIRYQFDLMNCIRLDILLQSAELYKVRGGQALYLMNSIIDHCMKIQKQNSTHYSLTSDKVWLVTKEGSEKVKILFSDKLNYEIHFTGYDDIEEPMNWNQNFICKEVLIEILQSFKKFKSTRNNKQVNGASLGTIQSKLLEIINQKDILMKEFQQEINDILIIYRYSFQEQQLHGLDSIQYRYCIFGMLSGKRNKCQKKIMNGISNIMNLYVNNENDNPLNQLLKQLDFDDCFLNSYQTKVIQNLKKICYTQPIINENKKFQNLPIQNVTYYYLWQLKNKYLQNEINQMDKEVQKYIKIKKTILNDIQLEIVIYKHLNKIQLQSCNSIRSYNQYYGKSYQFSNKFHSNLIREIKQLYQNELKLILTKMIQQFINL